MTRDRLLKPLVRERFVVTLRSGETFTGLLDQWDANHVVLVAAATVSEAAHPMRVDGQLFLPRGQIAYMQRLSA
ncbi:MAG TPA: hypothetical protein VFW64_12205 [Pseudonocardiaceae bacterium]|nr:hypothetical protein [Pseudonocardiaceae bacterium]